jgi:F-type H+-transporting ATPase subunit alpha
MLNANEISYIIQSKIENTNFVVEYKNKGIVISVADGIVKVFGLSQVMQGEVITFADGIKGIAMNLERDSVGIILFGDYTKIKEGDEAFATGNILEAPVGEGLLGRVVDALGSPIDGQGSLEHVELSVVEKIAPGVIDRQSVSQPLATGIKAIDSMIPIGRGQRELIIGDRQTGKTAIAIDTIINQKNTGVKCIYVAIGQKASSVANIVSKLKQHDALKHTIIVVASASDSASLQYIAPYVGCTMGEYFRDKGEDALIIYDDLSKHAVAYRQISLLLRRPPGREAYPGDVFYLHSRLLERAARVSVEYIEKITKGEVKGQTGSLTALPIIETQAGDVSAFVPTNVISITDGQIFLETDLFNSGIRPAINPGISVSRVGGAAQTKAVKKLSGGIRLALAQYRELQSFAQFASDLDESTRKQLQHGELVTELMKQKQYMPLSLSEMVVALFAIEHNAYEAIAISKALNFEADLIKYAKLSNQNLLDRINETGAISSEDEQLLKELLKKFRETYLSVL